MDGEIILDRGTRSVMKLDDNEQAMMDEIQLDFSRPRTHAHPNVQRMHGHHSMGGGLQEDVDAFANPVKQSATSPTPGRRGGRSWRVYG